MNNKIRDAFDKVQVDDILKQNTLEYVLQKTQKKPHISYKRLALLAAALLLLSVAVLSCFVYFIPISVISVDVNPSIELEINRFDKVIKANGFNDDGKRILSSAKIRFMNYTEAVETLLHSANMSEYMTEDNFVCITVVDEKEDKQKEILCEIENCTKEYKNISYSSEKPEKVKDAHKEGMSYGKFKAYLDLKDCEPETTIDEVRDCSMKEIHDKIDDHKKHQNGNGEPHKENEKHDKGENFDESSAENSVDGFDESSSEDIHNPNDNPPEKPNDKVEPKPEDNPPPKPDMNGNGNGQQNQNQNRPEPNNQAPDGNNPPDDSSSPTQNEDSIVTDEPIHHSIPDMNDKSNPNGNGVGAPDKPLGEMGKCAPESIITPDADRNAPPPEPTTEIPSENVGN